MDELVGFILIVLLLVLMLGVTTFVAHVQPVKVLVAAAARNCARAGVETLAAGRGLLQAEQTGVETALAGMGGGIDPEGLAVRAYAADVWGRGRVFVCETGYSVDVSSVPLVGWFYPRDAVRLRARVALRIEPYKARWGR
ncbi:MAG TPA: hypothetical protein G4O00_07290 [Thermoflexia bacterium]|nr:hypothetical protein [Thermoflexia bacterium]